MTGNQSLTKPVVRCEPQAHSMPAQLALTTNAERVRAYLDNARSRNTVRGYRSAFRQFQRWCEQSGLSEMPTAPETIAAYLAHQAGRLKSATLHHHLAAISKAHKAAGFASPIRDSVLVSETLKGIERVHGRRQTQKAALMADDIRVILRDLPDTNVGARDRALLLIGFSGAFRRSELVALDREDVSFSAEGLTAIIRRSKTDQSGEGRVIAIPCGRHSETCPVTALKIWMELACITTGPLFRSLENGNCGLGRITNKRLSAKSVASIVKKCAKAIGLDATTFAGHSLRSGFITSAVRAGAPERVIQLTSGHKSIDMLLKYVRVANRFVDNAALAIGL